MPVAWMGKKLSDFSVGALVFSKFVSGLTVDLGWKFGGQKTNENPNHATFGGTFFPPTKKRSWKPKISFFWFRL